MSKKPPVTGQTLISAFQTAFVNAATIQAAKYEASRSEHQLVDELAAMSSGTYLNPGSIANVNPDALGRASLDAHIKKVQAQQLNAMSLAQLQSLIAESKESFTGRKVRINVKDSQQQPIDIVWFDQQNGYRTSVARKRVVSGKIEDIMLDRNMLILKPGAGLRLLNGRLQNYLVYIINPDTLEPMVDITVI